MTTESWDEREQSIIDLVTEAAPGLTLQTARVVQTLEGADIPALRFTLEEAASSDLSMALIHGTQEDPATLAQQVIEDLRGQLPPSSPD